MRQALDDASRAIVDAFLEWFRGCGGHLSSDLFYAIDDKMGLSVYSSKDLRADFTAIHVPRGCCITASLAYESIMKLFDAQAVDKPALNGKEWIVFYLFLHKIIATLKSSYVSNENGFDRKEKRQRRENGEAKADQVFMRHAAYVQLLPERTLTPLHFHKSEMTLLRSTPLYGHAIESRKNSRRSYYKAVKWVESGIKGMSGENEWALKLLDALDLPDTGLSVNDGIDIEAEFVACGEDEKHCPTLAIWRWAETAYGSRAFPGRVIGEEEQDEFTAPVLVPGLDSFNHSRDAKVTWTWESKPEPYTSLTLHNGCKKDEQVFNSYGPKSNEELLASYGFVNEGMEDDVLTLKLGGQMNGLSSKQHHWRYDEACPPALIAEVEEVLRDGEEWDEREADKYDLLEGERVVQDTIINLLESKLKSFQAVQQQTPESIKHDTTIRPSVAHATQVYRKGQFRILQRALATSQAKVKELTRKIDSFFDENQHQCSDNKDSTL